MSPHTPPASPFGRSHGRLRRGSGDTRRPAPALTPHSTQPAADELPTRLAVGSLLAGNNVVQLLQVRPACAPTPLQSRLLRVAVIAAGKRALSAVASAAAQYNGESLAPVPGIRLLLPAPAVAAEFAPQQASCAAAAAAVLAPQRLTPSRAARVYAQDAV